MATTLTPQVPGGTSLANPTTTAPTTNMPWKSYDQYFKDKGQGDLASQYGAYHSSYMPGPAGTDQGRWGPSGNPYRFAEEYNQYKSTLPQQYQELIGYGINPEDVASGKVNSIVRPTGLEKINMPTAPGATPGSAGTYGTGLGSTFSLSPDILSKMWR